MISVATVTTTEEKEATDLREQGGGAGEGLYGGKGKGKWCDILQSQNNYYYF